MRLSMDLPGKMVSGVCHDAPTSDNQTHVKAQANHNHARDAANKVGCRRWDLPQPVPVSGLAAATDNGLSWSHLPPCNTRGPTPKKHDCAPYRVQGKTGQGTGLWLIDWIGLDRHQTTTFFLVINQLLHPSTDKSHVAYASRRGRLCVDAPQHYIQGYIHETHWSCMAANAEPTAAACRGAAYGMSPSCSIRHFPRRQIDPVCLRSPGFSRPRTTDIVAGIFIT